MPSCSVKADSDHCLYDSAGQFHTDRRIGKADQRIHDREGATSGPMHTRSYEAELCLLVQTYWPNLLAEYSEAVQKNLIRSGAPAAHDVSFMHGESSQKTRHRDQIGQQPLPCLQPASSWPNNGHLRERICLKSNCIHYSINTCQRIMQRKCYWLDAGF